jgi:hypothetical protein
MNKNQSIIILPKLSAPKSLTRISELRNEHGYGIGRTALIKRWKILDPEIKGILKINNIPINLDYLDGTNFDLCKIRQSLRDIIPESKEDNDLYVAESTMFGSQLEAINYYKYFPVKQLSNYLFTGTLCITFDLCKSEGNIPEKISIEEELILSDTQLLQRLSGGESLDDIDKNNIDQSMSLNIND